MFNKTLNISDVSFGCDPEFFFNKKNKVIESSEVLPKEGIKIAKGDYSMSEDRGSTITIDGVQVELNPQPYHCRAYVGNEISRCFKKLSESLDNDVKIDFSQMVKLSPKELKAMSDGAKRFGCMPSFNSNKGGSVSKIKVNPAKYGGRSAGGHIHIGAVTGENNKSLMAILRQPLRVVPMMDIIVGNTCVLIDRNKANVERRRNYGKAGEYRTPNHGLEYRTLSNFWLQSYQLMSLVMGLARLAVTIVERSTPENNYEKAVRDVVSMKQVEKAINTNNFKLAYSNFKKIEPILMAMIRDQANLMPFCNKNIRAFHHFISKPMHYWFPVGPLEHWLHLPDGHNRGWESFLDGTVTKDMNK